jgi:hypothetical protein
MTETKKPYGTNIQHSAFNIRHSAFSIRHSAFDIQPSAFTLCTPLDGGIHTMTRRKKSLPNPAVTLLLACAVPGAGHVYLGRAKRGLIIFVTVAALFWSGVAIGGVMTVDPQSDRWWFIAQMFTGSHGLVAWQREKKTVQKLMAPAGSETLDQRLIQAKIHLSGQAETIARAYSGVAGLMNLMCIFDALLLSAMGVRGEPAADEQDKKEAVA